MQVDLKGQVAWVTGGAGGIGRAVSFALAILTLTHLPGVLAVAAEPEGATAEPSAAELIEGIIAQESKIDSVHSLYLRFVGKWTHTPETIAHELAKQMIEHPGVAIDIAGNPSLWSENEQELELAFDGKRLRKLRHFHQDYFDLKVFDGERAMEHEKTLTSGEECYSLDTSPRRILDELFGLGCELTGPNRLWFGSELTADEKANIDPRPKDYTFIGVADFRGRRCYDLENATARRRLHVGVDDRRLYGVTDLYSPTGPTFRAFGTLAGRKFATSEEIETWLDGLTNDKQARVLEDIDRQRFSLMRPLTESFMDEYRELAPGLWLPATQGYELDDSEAEKPHFGTRRELHLVEAKVNERLADKLFTIELADGIEVRDFSYDPPLVYQQQADRTPEQWESIVGDRKRRSDESNKE